MRPVTGLKRSGEKLSSKSPIEVAVRLGRMGLDALLGLSLVVEEDEGESDSRAKNEENRRLLPLPFEGV